MATYNTGYTQEQAVAQVQQKTNEPTIVSAANITQFLNDGLDALALEIEPVVTYTTVSVASTDVTKTLPEDVQDIVALFYSATTPLQPGWIPYEMTQFDPKQFMLVTGGVPTYAGGPPFCYCIIGDAAGQMTIQIGSPMAGYLFIMYHQRAAYWDPGTTGSTTNVDPSYQRAAVLYACVQVCESTENYRKAQYFQKLFDDLVEDLKSKARRRVQRKPSMVRDVTSGQTAWPFPFFWGRRS